MITMVDLDILIAGDNNGTFTQIYKNNGAGSFVYQSQINLQGICWGSGGLDRL